MSTTCLSVRVFSRRSLSSLLFVLALHPAAGQPVAAHCRRETTTSFTFGNVGGTLVPTGLEISRAGQVRRRDGSHPGALLGSVPRDSVIAAARFAWRSGFARLPTAPTKPTRNPDAARHFIELHSDCGTKHVEYGPGDESSVFQQLWDRLSRLTTSTGQRPL
jgi:hypothetical protein